MEKTVLIEIPKWGIEKTGYKPKTKVWERLCVAERMSKDILEAETDRMITENITDTEAITETVMALNWKVWQHAEKNRELSKTYEKMYQKADRKALENLEGKDLEYYYLTTD